MINMYEPYQRNDTGLKYYESIYIGMTCNKNTTNGHSCNYVENTNSSWVYSMEPDPTVFGNYCIVVSRNYSDSYKWKMDDCATKRGIVCAMTVPRSKRCRLDQVTTDYIKESF